MGDYGVGDFTAYTDDLCDAELVPDVDGPSLLNQPHRFVEILRAEVTPPLFVEYRIESGGREDPESAASVQRHVFRLERAVFR